MIAFFETPNEIVKLMLSLIENKEFKTILDTGFGKGAFLNELVNHPFKKISGIEINTPFFNKILKTIDNTNSTLKLLNDDYLNYKFIEKFDTIIGNPPYLKSDLLTPLMKENVRKITQSGEGNIYYAFILKSIELLKEEGELVYIVPYDFFFNTYGECVRKCMVENGYLDTLIYLGDYPLFSKAAPDTLIFKFKKSIYKNNTKIFKLTNKKISLETLTKEFNNALITLSSNTTFNYTQQLSFTHSSSWNLSSYDKKELIPLLNEATIYVGLVNGADKIFHLSKTIIETFNEEEKHLFLKPIIKAHNLKNGKIENINESMYLYFDKKYTEEELKEYQNVYHYLLFHKEMLSKRVGMKHWWEYTALRNIEKMKQNKLKIITPHITRKQNDWFSLSNENYFVGGDMLIIEGKDDTHTLEIFKILSSKEFENYYQESGAKKGNRIVFTHKLLKELQIPKNML